MARLRATPTSDAAENAETRQPGAYDNIEQRPLGERCIIAFSSSSGPPMLPTYFYNNMKQMVQTKDYVMILTEMVHDVADHPVQRTRTGPTAIRKWLGDSIARWEGDTLVVETTNFNDKTRFRGSSEQLKVTERFTRVDDRTLLYRFTIEDPTTWARPWTGEYTWALGEAGRPAVRVRLPRRQLRDDWYHEGGPHPGGRGSGRQGAVEPLAKRGDERAMLMKNKLMVVAAGAALAFATAVPVVAHHAFGAEFDANRPVLLKGKVVKVELGEPARVDPRRGREGRRRHRSVDGRGRHAEHAAAPRHHQEHAHDRHRNGRRRLSEQGPVDRANGRDITFPDGKKLFMGSSGTGAPRDGRDATEPPK